MIFQPHPNLPWTAWTIHHKTMELHVAENGGAASVEEEEASQESSGSKLTTSAPHDPSHTSNNVQEAQEPAADASLLQPPPPAPPDEQRGGDGIGGAPPAVTSSTSSSSSNYFVPQIAKDRLSKWAARLFDPDRPKGVIQPPQTIPLNDEFLSAFGKREQERDALTGQTLTIDRTIRDDEDNDGNGWIKDPPTEASTAPAADEANPPLAVDTKLPSSNDDMNETTTTATKTPTTISGDDKNNDTGITNVSRNVKISNLRFTTTQSELEGLCQRFGDIEKTTLIKNPSDETKNMGLAFVLFATKESAARCLAELTTIQNRTVTVTEAKPPGEKNNSTNGAKKRKAAARYWETEMDLSLKCYHCGLYGHMASACQNAKLLKPCTLCGVTTHDARNCDKKVFCFTCGLPGHPSRDCPDRHQPVRRLICTICYREDHHKSQCRSSSSGRIQQQQQQQYRGVNNNNAGEQQQQPPYGLANAVCMVCGKLGHFSCQRVSVFYGLRGLCCCNWYVFAGVFWCLFIVVCLLEKFIYNGFLAQHFWYSGDLGHTIHNCHSPNLAMCDRNEAPPMPDVGWTAAQVQAAIVQLNQGQVARPVMQDASAAAAGRGGGGDRHYRPSHYNHTGEANNKKRRMR